MKEELIVCRKEDLFLNVLAIWIALRYLEKYKKGTTVEEWKEYIDIKSFAQLEALKMNPIQFKRMMNQTLKHFAVKNPPDES